MNGEIKYECSQCGFLFPDGSKFETIWPCPQCGNNNKMHASMTTNTDGYKKESSKSKKKAISKE